jgi:Alginate lyase
MEEGIPMRRPVIALAAAMAVATAVTVGTTAQAATAKSPTSGLTRYSDTFKVQHPYNLPESARFSAVGGVYSAWIVKGDKGFSKGTKTGPRTEMRWSANWTSGEHMFDADVMIDPGTEGTAIMQVKSNTKGEPIYLVVQKGNLYHGTNTRIATGVVGHWFHLTVDYNPSAGVAHVWVDNNEVFTRKVAGKGGTYYFKNGVYNISGARSQTHWRNITFWK